jgi:hypothetical protein
LEGKDSSLLKTGPENIDNLAEKSQKPYEFKWRYLCFS